MDPIARKRGRVAKISDTILIDILPRYDIFQPNRLLHERETLRSNVKEAVQEIKSQHSEKVGKTSEKELIKIICDRLQANKMSLTQKLRDIIFPRKSIQPVTYFKTSKGNSGEKVRYVQNFFSLFNDSMPFLHYLK